MSSAPVAPAATAAPAPPPSPSPVTSTTPAPPAARIPIKDRPLKPKPEPEPRIKILKDGSIESVADLIAAGNAKNIIVMTGAGISTAAGIKDFRSPGTGLYDDLEKYNLPFPEAVFDLAFFKETPGPFYHLAKHLYPGQYRPTLTHYLLPLLAKKKLLLRSYTQNIDSLERLAGLDEDLLVEAHGSFASSKCVQCEMMSDSAWVKRHIMEGEIPYCKRCSGLVKPSITFFGENVPLRFTTMAETDFDKCDLLIVLGTSLKVEPFNKLIAKVSPKCPRLLINREKAGQELHSGFDFEDKWKYTVQRDAVYLGNCDDGVRRLASLCGWEDELQIMHDAGHEHLKVTQDDEKGQSKATKDEDDEDEDSERDEFDNEDESDSNKSGSDMADSSSLEDITHRFRRSTLRSQSDSSSDSSEPGSSSGPVNVTVEVKKIVKVSGNPKAPKVLKQEGATTSGGMGSVEEDLKDTKEMDVSVKETARAAGHKGLVSLVRRKSTTTPPTTNEPVDSGAGDITQAEVIVPAKAARAPTVAPLVSPPASPSSVRPSASASATSPSPSEYLTDTSPSSARSSASGSPFGASPSGSSTATSSTKSLGPAVYSRMGSLTDIGSPATLETSLASSSSSTYTPLTIAVATASSQQPFSPCVPVMAICTNSTSDMFAMRNGSSLFNFDIGNGAGDNHISNRLVGSSSMHSIGSGSSNGGGGGGGSGRAEMGPGSLQMMRRKRRKDFEGTHCSGSLKSEYRYLRGPSMLPPHYLTCGRVTKRRRMV